MQQKESRIPMSQKPKQDDSEWKTNINHVDKKKAAPGIQWEYHQIVPSHQLLQHGGLWDLPLWFEQSVDHLPELCCIWSKVENFI